MLSKRINTMGPVLIRWGVFMLLILGYHELSHAQSSVTLQTLLNQGLLNRFPKCGKGLDAERLKKIWWLLKEIHRGNETILRHNKRGTAERAFPPPEIPEIRENEWECRHILVFLYQTTEFIRKTKERDYQLDCDATAGTSIAIKAKSKSLHSQMPIPAETFVYQMICAIDRIHDFDVKRIFGCRAIPGTHSPWPKSDLSGLELPDAVEIILLKLSMILEDQWREEKQQP